MFKLKKIIGPGFITGAADNDPSGIATYSQTGAQFGYSQLWTALYCVPFTIVIQEMCTRISIVTKKGITTTLSEHYNNYLVYFMTIVFFVANIVNIGADLNAVAECLQLLIGFNFYFWLFFISIVILLLEIFLSYKIYSKILYFFAFFVVCYVIVGLMSSEDWKKVFINTIIPYFSFNNEYFLNIIAVIGTTISPYMFFWQPAQQIEEIKNDHNSGQVIIKNKSKEIQYMRYDTIIGMVTSNLIMFFIILSAATILNKHGITNIETASDAAKALEPLAGKFSEIVFSIGIISLGLLTIPILAASSSYVFCEAFDKRCGLNEKFKKARYFYSVIILVVLSGLLVNLTGIKPFKMLYYAAALNGIIAPILIAIITLIASNKKIMGNKVNSIFSNVISWSLTFILTFFSIVLIYNLLKK